MTSLPTPQHSGHVEVAPQSPGDEKACTDAAYASLSSRIPKRPTLALMENSGNRPDVATVAILGYN